MQLLKKHKPFIYKVLRPFLSFIPKIITKRKVFQKIDSGKLEFTKGIRELVIFYQSVNAHKDYNQLLKTLVPEWNIQIDKAFFTGKGGGKGNLNTYRKVQSNDELLFEKIYFVEQDDFQNVLNVNTIIKNIEGLFCPEIQIIFKGEKINIVYFNFMQLIKISKKEMENALITTSHQLILFSENSSFQPNCLSSISSYEIYLRNRSRAENELNKIGLHFNQIEEQILKSKKWFSHGDLTGGNVFNENCVIDWDFAGYYPIGCDVARLYVFLFDYNCPKGSLLQWLEKHYQSIVLKENWEAFVKNFMFFLFVFSIGAFHRKNFSMLKEEIISHLKTIKN